MQRADRHHVSFLASALTFDALLALVPLVVLLLVGVTAVAGMIHGADALTPTDLFHRLLPQHPIGDTDPFKRIERILVRVTEVRGQASLVAVPAFLWLSMRVFAAVRIAMDTISETPERVQKVGAQLLGFLLAKVRDAAMVVVTVALFLANTAVSAGVRIAEDVGSARVPALGLLLSGVGRLAAEVLAIVFSVLPFWLVYRYASTKVIRARAALAASLFTAVGFEIAKRLYGIYLGQARTLETVARGDADLLAAFLFVLWVHMTGLVFLIGGALAHTLQDDWSARRRR